MSEQIKITFLGTSDQIPSKERNHTAILLNFREENLLFDCGEGTQRQFRKAELNPCKITRILISHWHGDHVFGLPGILSTLALSGYANTGKTLHIYGPRGTEYFIKELLKIFNFKREYPIRVTEIDKEGIFLDEKDFYLEAGKLSHGIPALAYNFVKKGYLRIDKGKLKKLKIPEGKHLAGLKLGKDITYEKKKYKFKELTYKEDEKKISIILDTLYEKKFSLFAKHADLLICESSFSHDLEEKAKEHLHLTAKQAGEIAKQAHAKKLILTHISQRYEYNPEKILKEAKVVFKNTLIAKDLDSFEI